MSEATKVTVEVNLQKIFDLKGAQSFDKYGTSIDFNPIMLYKIAKGERWKWLGLFAEFCSKTNCEPNDFFIITKKG